jgi:hypothetical protein
MDKVHELKLLSHPDKLGSAEDKARGTKAMEAINSFTALFRRVHQNCKSRRGTRVKGGT